MGVVLQFESECLDLGLEPSPAGFQHASLDVLEAGEVEVGEFVEEPLGLVEAALEILGGRAQGRGIAGRSASEQWIGQKRLPGGGIGSHAVSGQEGLGGAGGERMALDRLGQARLLGFRERGQIERDRERKLARVQAHAEFGRETAGQRQSPFRPARLPPQELGDGSRGHAVVLDETPDDAGLVHGAERFSRAVGLEELGFLEDARGVFDDHGHLRLPVPLPLGQAFKAIEDLVGLLVHARDADRERRERGGGSRPRPAQGQERRAEVTDRDGEDERRHGRSSSAVSW